MVPFKNNVILSKTSFFGSEVLMSNRFIATKLIDISVTF